MNFYCRGPIPKSLHTSYPIYHLEKDLSEFLHGFLGQRNIVVADLYEYSSPILKGGVKERRVAE